VADRETRDRVALLLRRAGFGASPEERERYVGLGVEGPLDGGLIEPKKLLGADVRPDDGDLKHTVDFRSVYATVLEAWFGAPSAPILGGTYERIGFLG
jgi:hypothetical protein